MTVLWVVIWMFSAIASYFLMAATVLCCNRLEWDRDMRKSDMILSLLLGPIFLVIALELFVLAEIGKGMEMKKRHTFP